MLKTIREMNGHHLICGWNRVARQILRELLATHRQVVVIAPPEARAGADVEGTAACLLEGDPTSDELLEEAGVVRAAGVFAATEDDQTNIVVCLSVHRLNAKARIVAACREPANSVKMQKVGAHATVSVIAIGGPVQPLGGALIAASPLNQQRQHHDDQRDLSGRPGDRSAEVLVSDQVGVPRQLQ